jgi:hypothetical protein
VISSAVVGDLTVPTTSGYTSSPLTGIIYNATKWTFNTFSFPKYLFASVPTGVVSCKRLGTVPSINDLVICYSDFNNSIGQTINLQVGAYVVNLQFGVDGAIKFSYRYQYSSGAFANNEAIPKGLIYMIGSNNATTSFTNPYPGKIKTIDNFNWVNIYTNRSSVGQGSTGGALQQMFFDFKTLRIKIGKIGLQEPVNSIPRSIEIYGSNNLDLVNYSVNWATLSMYDLLFSSTAVSAFNGSWFVVDCNTTLHYRFLMIRTQCTNNFAISQIELYNSSILSPTLDMV